MGLPYGSEHGTVQQSSGGGAACTTVVCMVLCNKALEVGLQYYSSVHAWLLCNKALEVGLQYYSSVHGYCATKLWRWGCSTTVLLMQDCFVATYILVTDPMIPVTWQLTGTLMRKDDRSILFNNLT